MLDKLIEEGEKLEGLSQPGAYGIGKVLSGGELQKWVAKSILYLEKHKPASSLTQMAIEHTKGSVGYDEYEYLLGVLKAIQES